MSQLREYEVFLVLSTNLEEEPRKQIIEDFSKTLTYGEGDSAAPIVNIWGRRQLAYPIRKQTDGYYVFYEALMDGSDIREIERNLNYNENVLRYMFVRKRDDGKDVAEEVGEEEDVEEVAEEATETEATPAETEAPAEEAAAEVSEEAPAEETEAPAAGEETE